MQSLDAKIIQVKQNAAKQNLSPDETGQLFEAMLHDLTEEELMSLANESPTLPKADAEDEVLSEQDYAAMLDDLPLSAIDPLVDWGTGEG